MHQSIPGVPMALPASLATAGHLPTFFCPGGGALANFAQPERWVFAKPGATPKLLAHTCIPIQTYMYMEDFTKNTIRFKDWPICHGQEKLIEVF